MKEKIKKTDIIIILLILLIGFGGWMYLNEYRLRYCEMRYSVSKASNQVVTGGRLYSPATPQVVYSSCMGEPLYKFLFK